MLIYCLLELPVYVCMILSTLYFFVFLHCFLNQETSVHTYVSWDNLLDNNRHKPVLVMEYVYLLL